MSTTTLVQVKMDSNLRNEANSICNDLGIDMPTAIRIFFKKMIAVQGIPFEMKTGKAQDGAVFDSIRNDIQKNNVKEMSLDEINGEINEARKNLRNN
ncbi:MAG: type II toxin-antitoxin system RelB/DinJ family antitoxin [Treponema sp.]